MNDEYDPHEWLAFEEAKKRSLSFHFPEWLSEAETRQTPADSATATETDPHPPSSYAQCIEPPVKRVRTRKRYSEESKGVIKRVKREPRSIVVNEKADPGPREEAVFLRLNRVVMEVGMNKKEYTWQRRYRHYEEENTDSGITVRDEDLKTDISWAFHHPNHESLSLEVRLDGIRYLVRLSWDDRQQLGEDLDQKITTVSDEEMKSMHRNPDNVQFEGRRRQLVRSQRYARTRQRRRARH